MIISNRRKNNEIFDELAEIRKIVARPPSEGQQFDLSVAIHAARQVGASDVEIANAQRKK